MQSPDHTTSIRLDAEHQVCLAEHVSVYPDGVLVRIGRVRIERRYAPIALGALPTRLFSEALKAASDHIGRTG